MKKLQKYHVLVWVMTSPGRNCCALVTASFCTHPLSPVVCFFWGEKTTFLLPLLLLLLLAQTFWKSCKALMCVLTKWMSTVNIILWPKCHRSHKVKRFTAWLYHVQIKQTGTHINTLTSSDTFPFHYLFYWPLCHLPIFFWKKIKCSNHRAPPPPPLASFCVTYTKKHCQEEHWHT